MEELMALVRAHSLPLIQRSDLYVRVLPGIQAARILCSPSRGYTRAGLQQVLPAPCTYPFALPLLLQNVRLPIARSCISLPEGALWLLLVWHPGSAWRSFPQGDLAGVKTYPSSPSLRGAYAEYIPHWCSDSHSGTDLQLSIAVASLVTPPVLSAFPPFYHGLPNLHHLNCLHLILHLS